MNEHDIPCDELKEVTRQLRVMNDKYIADITGIHGDLKTIKEYMENHWNEIKEERKEQREVNKIVREHEIFITGISRKRDEIRWSIAIIAGLIGSIPSIIVMLIALFKK